MAKRNMNKWIEDMIANDKKPALPILSFPAAQMQGITVNELVSNSDYQARGVKLISDTYNVAAAQCYMNLSAEAEAFGATAIHSDNEIPTIVGQLISTPEQADELQIPAMGTGQTSAILEGVEKARALVPDKVLFAECIGPYSLAGRLMNVNEIMINCYDEPEMVHTVLEKSTAFIIDYMKEFKKRGADGVIMAEPLTGILSPTLADEFSHPYVKQILDAVQDENFIVIYHNCGNETVHMLNGIFALGAKAYHFGDSIDMTEIVAQSPADILVMGNISPANQFVGGTVESIKEATKALLSKCSYSKNFWISSGCDVPPQTNPGNIKAFFDAIDEFYAAR